MATKRWLGCNDNCFECTYKDCLKPDNECSSIPWEAEEMRGKKKGETYGNRRKKNLQHRSTIDEALDELLLR